MVNKRFWLGILVIVLVFGFLLTGCEMEDLSGSYTFEFKVKYDYGWTSNYITMIEIFNGSSVNATKLATEDVNIALGSMSTVYTVSGFSEKDGSDKRIFGIKITYNNGDTHFNWSSWKNKGKILVKTSNFWDSSSFEEGNW
jgi:hypothetical protein